MAAGSDARPPPDAQQPPAGPEEEACTQLDEPGCHDGTPQTGGLSRKISGEADILERKPSGERSLFMRRRPERTLTGGSVENFSPDTPSGQLSRRHRESRDWSFDARSLVPERVDSCISHRYEIDAQEIGVGGYGRVYTARDRVCKDRRVAVKKLVRSADEKVEALMHEVDIMKVLDHPSICKLFETWVQDRIMYFVIEYLEGGDLCDLIMDKSDVEERTAAYIIKQASSALRYAHGRGIAHRDMKPENVCFCSSDPSNHRVKVIDWGLGKHFSQTRMKSSVGSGAFTAPEVLDPPTEDAGYTSACDLWSLGVMAYVLISGKPPFFGGPLQMLRNMREERYPMAGPFWSGVSADAKSFISSVLKCNPEERLPVDSLLSHPWLARQFVEVDEALVGQVLSNVEQFSHAPDFLSICVASVARHMDHRSLEDMYRVFCVLDTNNNGVLELDEIRAGFVAIFGEDSVEVAQVVETFAHLDLDSTSCITYTEFCAAGIGENSYTQEHVLWAAFKTFDVDDNGKITTDDMRQMLSRADVSEVWSERVCEEVSDRAGTQGNPDELRIAIEKAEAHGGIETLPARKQYSEIQRMERHSPENVHEMLKWAIRTQDPVILNNVIKEVSTLAAASEDLATAKQALNELQDECKQRLHRLAKSQDNRTMVLVMERARQMGVPQKDLAWAEQYLQTTEALPSSRSLQKERNREAAGKGMKQLGLQTR